jgi:hypothetical protein
MPVETYSEGEMPYEEFDTMVEDAGGTELDTGYVDESGEILTEEAREARLRRNAEERKKAERARKLREFVGKAGKALSKAGGLGAKVLGDLFAAKPPEPDIYSAPQAAPPAQLAPEQIAPMGASQQRRPGDGFFGRNDGGEPLDKMGLFSGGEMGGGMFGGGGGGLSPLLMPQRRPQQQFDLFTSQPAMGEQVDGGMMAEEPQQLEIFGGEAGDMWGIGGGGGESMLSSGEGNAEAMLFGGAQPRGRKQAKQEGFDLFGAPKAAKQGGGGFDLFGSATTGTTKRGKHRGLSTESQRQPKTGGFDLFGMGGGKRQKGEGVTLF